MPAEDLFHSYDYLIAHYWKLAGNWFDPERSGCEADSKTFDFIVKNNVVVPVIFQKGIFFLILEMCHDNLHDC